jgi:hypothetical protein
MVNDSGGEGRPHASVPGWLQPGTLLAAFLAVYVACAIGAQTLSSIEPSDPGAPIEAFTSGLLWIIAMFGLVRSSESIGNAKRLTFWLVFTAAVSALAIDEIVELHERTEPAFNDDWVKVLMWLATPFVLYYIAKLERASRDSLIAMVTGYVFHSAYLLVEIGDGALFTLPIAIDTLKWAEELFELLFLASYTFALWILLLRRPRLSLTADPPKDTGGV